MNAIELLTAEDLSELLKMSPNQIVLRARRGTIPAINLFGKLRFNAVEIDAWLESNRITPVGKIASLPLAGSRMIAVPMNDGGTSENER